MKKKNKKQKKNEKVILAVCVLAYLPVFLVIFDTVIITQLNRRFLHVPNLIREVTALRWDV